MGLRRPRMEVNCMNLSKAQSCWPIAALDQVLCLLGRPPWRRSLEAFDLAP